MLNDDQLAVVNANEHQILCLAGAGTGKTYSLIQRISRLVDDGVDPSSILVLTFTNAAAFEMRDRYNKINVSKISPEFRTFHSFCYSLITNNKSVRMEIGYSELPSIADDDEVRRITNEAYIQTGCKLSSRKLSGKYTLTQKEQFDLAVVRKATKRILKSRNLITFDNLCYDVCKLFVDDHECVRYYKDKYKYVYADEMQDTDPKQFDFIMSFKNSDKFVVGDALQALYAFRGADSSIIKNLSEDSDWKTYVLRKNYRSGSNICNFANMNTSYANDSYRIILESTRDGGFVDVVHSYGKPRHRGDLMDIKAMDTLLSLTRLDGSSAILARTNQEVGDISRYLSDKGVDMNTSDDGTDMKILKSVSDKEYMLRWLSSSLPNDMYANYIRLSGKDDCYDIDKFLEDFKTDYIHNMVKKIDDISSIINSGLDNTTMMFSLVSYMKLTKLPENNLSSLDELIQFLDNQSDNKSEKSVYVGTIHSSKGLEYDNVCLYGVGGPSFQLTNEENCNVYYVGITRAKNVLYVLEG